MNKDGMESVEEESPGCLADSMMHDDAGWGIAPFLRRARIWQETDDWQKVDHPGARLSSLRIMS
jgi:hypothetical protein